MRRNGILLPISALPSKYGIGCFSQEAYQFVDQLAAAGQSLWQILPLGPTGYGDSPYQSVSTFAGNPYFIDLEALTTAGLLSEAECQAYDFGNNNIRIDYQKLFENRFRLLKAAYQRAVQKGESEHPDYLAFCQQEQYWLEDYALFMAIKQQFGHRSWDNWDEDIRLRRPEALVRYRLELREEVDFQKYLQYLFAAQWQKLKRYANDKGIQIVGDIPIYVAFDSADTWAQPQLYQLDEALRPKAVAGCPPDGFSKTGQLWGNPLYDWAEHQRTGFDWWIRRVDYCMKWYDITRIDHFRGFDEYYAVPFGSRTARDGYWMPGPKMALFETIQAKLGSPAIIAEDLGYLNDSVRELLKNSGYPGMKVLQFAFDSREESDYLPHNYDKNCVVYTGTHDNATLRQWLEEISPEDRRAALRYLNAEGHTDREIHWDIICLAMSSVADTCIIPVQDFMYLGAEARINIPSTLGGNWGWRIDRGMLSVDLIAKIRSLTTIYGRLANTD